jgi:hypothetical protein
VTPDNRNYTISFGKAARPGYSRRPKHTGAGRGHPGRAQPGGPAVAPSGRPGNTPQAPSVRYIRNDKFSIESMLEAVS